MLICSPFLALRLCSSTIFSCQPLFLLNAVSPAAPLIGIATRFDIPITPSPSHLAILGHALGHLSVRLQVVHVTLKFGEGVYDVCGFIRLERKLWIECDLCQLGCHLCTA